MQIALFDQIVRRHSLDRSVLGKVDDGQLEDHGTAWELALHGSDEGGIGVPRARTRRQSRGRHERR